MKNSELIQVHPDLAGELSDVDYTKSMVISCRCFLFVPVTSKGGFPQDLMTVHFPQELMTLYVYIYLEGPLRDVNVNVHGQYVIYAVTLP